MKEQCSHVFHIKDTDRNYYCQKREGHKGRHEVHFDWVELEFMNLLSKLEINQFKVERK